MKSKYIYITVDTECHDIDRINQYIYGKVDDGKEYGIRKILEIGKELNIPINFFLDVSECRRYGDKYVQDIVDLIRSYDQPIYFHFHPNFVSGDDSRSYLWQYSKDEQRELLKEGLNDYFKFCGKKERLFFRAGRYGIDNSTIEILGELGLQVVDLSYSSSNGKGMCHLSKEEYGYHNIPQKHNDIMIFPNTSYIGFDYCGRLHNFLLNCAQTPYGEFTRFIDKTQLNNIIYTMHSWDLIKKWFFCKNNVWGNKSIIKRFKKCINYAKDKGYRFCKLDDFSIQNDNIDELHNLCIGYGKILGLKFNFVRFWGIAHLTPKYFFIYMSATILLLLIVLFAIIFFVS